MISASRHGNAFLCALVSALLLAGCGATQAPSIDPAPSTNKPLAQSDAAADAFMAYLYYSPYPYANTSNVHGFYVTPLGNMHMENVWLSK